MNEHQAIKERLIKAVSEMETPNVLERVLKEPINAASDCDDNNNKPKGGNIIKRILSLFA